MSAPHHAKHSRRQNQGILCRLEWSFTMQRGEQTGENLSSHMIIAPLLAIFHWGRRQREKTHEASLAQPARPPLSSPLSCRDKALANNEEGRGDGKFIASIVGEISRLPLQFIVRDGRSDGTNWPLIRLHFLRFPSHQVSRSYPNSAFSK